MAPDYDYIIAGGGCAGLSLAYALAHSPLQDRRVLIVDREAKAKNDRTWSYWTDHANQFDHIVLKNWQKITFIGDDYHHVSQLEQYRYQTIRGEDFYREIKEKIASKPNFSWLFGEVAQVADQGDTALVEVNGQQFTAHYVFDSLYRPEQYGPHAADYHFTLQHFKGYVVRTPQPAFDPETITMFDFRTEQKDGAFFFYVLPFTADTALVEYTGFSKGLLPLDEYDAELRAYLRDTLQLTDYEIIEEEFGAIPMTDYAFPAREGRVVKIGVQGGQSKPSTGYAFYRIQQQVAALVKSLAETGAPFAVPRPKPQFRAYDSLLLNILHRDGEQIKPIFTQMFARNPIERILRFLNEDSSLYEDLCIITSVPPKPFLQAIRNVFLSPRLIK
jgi:lycopene beta-cyclase